MPYLNAFLRVVFDAALYPFRTLHPLVGLTLVSLVFGVFALLIFKWTSDQNKLEATKSKIHAGLFEIRLFNDDLRAIFRAMFQILRDNMTYLRLSLVPLLVMLPPFVLVIAQLQFHYGYQALKPGEKALVKVFVKDVETDDNGEARRPDVKLEAPAGLRVEAGPVWAPGLKELTWRIAAEDFGDYELEFTVDGGEVTKSVQVAEDLVARRSTLRPTSLLDQLLYPAEAPVPSSVNVEKITIAYPFGNAGIEGWESELTWIWVFLVLSIVFAFALRKPLGVTI